MFRNNYLDLDLGCANMKGELYEVKVAALLFARALNSSEDFYLATNMEAAGKFDDIVLKIRDKAAFIQLKHYTKTKKFKKEKNPLQMNGPYFQSYHNIKQQWQQNEDLKHCGTFDNASFVLYTNGIIGRGKGNATVNNYWQQILS
jgi:hypothetical protein